MKNMVLIGILNVILASCSSKFFANQSLTEHEAQTVKPLIIPHTFELPPAQNVQHHEVDIRIKDANQATNELIKR